MHDLEFPFLTLRIVSGLTGLAPREVRRLARLGIVAAPRRLGRRRADRLYSWREVEQLQRATYLLKSKRRPLDEVKRFLEESHAASLDRDWVIARPKPRPRRPGGSGGGRRRSSVREPR